MKEELLVISTQAIDACKGLAEVLVKMIPGGVLFVVVEGNTVVWMKQSDSFTIELFKVGHKLDESTTTMKAIRGKQILNENVPRSVYGMRLEISSIPVVNDEGESAGAFSIVVPKLHPVAAAFGDFAPILVEMFSEGSIIYMTDLQKVAYRQESKSWKLNIEPTTLGHELKPEDVAYKALKANEPITVEIDASRYGIPINVVSYPLLDDKKENFVATLGIVTPKQTAVSLRDMANNLGHGLGSIGAAIQQLAESASDIHTNEQSLNASIKEIIDYAEQINEVSVFIKEIAEETKMLGLNAAIEAARAGEAGRGFGVVAEEIRHLSEQSKGTVPKIAQLTNTIKEITREANEKSKLSLSSVQEQAAATEEITASIEEITAMSEELNNISKKL